MILVLPSGTSGRLLVDTDTRDLLDVALEVLCCWRWSTIDVTKQPKSEQDHANSGIPLLVILTFQLHIHSCVEAIRMASN